MSRKRKKPGQQRGGRYTPPRGGSPARPAPAAFDFPDADDEDDGDEEHDDRWPVTISLPSGGNRTVPQAFAEWVQAEGRLDEFDQFMQHRWEHGVKGDPLAPFLEGRDDVPADVATASDHFDDHLTHLFGPPVAQQTVSDTACGV